MNVQDSNEASTALTRGGDYAAYRAAFDAKKQRASSEAPRSTSTGDAESAGDSDALRWLYIAAGRNMETGLQLLRTAHDPTAPLPRTDATGDGSTTNTAPARSKGISSSQPRSKQRLCSPTRRAGTEHAHAQPAYGLLASHRTVESIVSSSQRTPADRTPAGDVTPATSRDGRYLGAEHGQLVPADMSHQASPPGGQQHHLSFKDEDDVDDDGRPIVQRPLVDVGMPDTSLHPHYRFVLSKREVARRKARKELEKRITLGLRRAGPTSNELIYSTNPRPIKRPLQLSPLPTPAKLKAQHLRQRDASARQRSPSPPRHTMSSVVTPAALQERVSERLVSSTQHHSMARIAGAASLPSRHDVNTVIADARAHFSEPQLRLLSPETAAAFLGQSASAEHNPAASEKRQRKVAVRASDSDAVKSPRGGDAGDPALEPVATAALSALVVSSAAAAASSTNVYAAQELYRAVAAGAPNTCEIEAFGHAIVETDLSVSGPDMFPEDPLLHPAEFAETRPLPRSASVAPAVSWLVASEPAATDEAPEAEAAAQPNAQRRFVVGIACSDSLAPAVGEPALPPDVTGQVGWVPVVLSQAIPIAPADYAARCEALIKREYVEFFETLTRGQIELEASVAWNMLTAQCELPYHTSTVAIRRASPVDHGRPDAQLSSLRCDFADSRFAKRQIMALERDEAHARDELFRDCMLDLVKDGRIFDHLQGKPRALARLSVAGFFQLGTVNETNRRLRYWYWERWSSWAREKRAVKFRTRIFSKTITGHFGPWLEAARRDVSTGIAQPLEAVLNRTDTLGLRVARWAWVRAIAVANDICSTLEDLGVSPDEDEVTFTGHGLGGGVAAALAMKLVTERKAGSYSPTCLTMFGAPPIVREDGPCMCAALQVCSVAAINVLSPRDPVLGLWEGRDAGAAVIADSGLRIVTCENLALEPAPSWGRFGWSFHSSDSYLTDTLKAVGRGARAATALRTPEHDAELLAFERLAWNPVEGRFATCIVDALKHAFTTLSRTAIGAQRSTLEPAVLAVALAKADPVVPAQLLLARLYESLASEGGHYAGMSHSQRATGDSTPDRDRSINRHQHHDGGGKSPRSARSLRHAGKHDGMAPFSPLAVMSASNRPAIAPLGNSATTSPITLAVFERFFETEFLCYSTQLVLDFLDVFGYFVAGDALRFDASLADSLMSQPPGSGSWPAAVISTRIAETLPSGVCSGPGTTSVTDVFEHFARRAPASPYVGSGLSLQAASPDCVSTMLELSRWSEAAGTDVQALVRRAWLDLESHAIERRPFRTENPPPNASLTMTFQGDATAKGFCRVLRRVEALVGPTAVSFMWYTLGFNGAHQHAITRGTLDNVHRRGATTCRCGLRDKGDARLHVAEEQEFRLWVEQELDRAQNAKLEAVASRANVLLELSQRRPTFRAAQIDEGDGVQSVRSTLTTTASNAKLEESTVKDAADDDQRHPGAARDDVSSNGEDDGFGKLTQVVSFEVLDKPKPAPAGAATTAPRTRPTANTPAVGRQAWQPSLSPALRGAGPLAGRLRPLASTPQPASNAATAKAAEERYSEKKARRKRSARRKRANTTPSGNDNATPPVSLNSHQRQSVSIYKLNRGISLLTQQQRQAFGGGAA